ncbi:thiosulfate oxidation carrier complex protein SoxZ [Panacagrimonas sp.]|uniref:thiosulfate oxidation carrier complex protein SoxZ n=1 Tax=Panacagrimonas sp. TaxID=2480088 RepID=UPI003B529EF9
MASPMRIRATTVDGVTEVKALMSHPMETGQRKDSAGKLVPAHHITEVTAMHNDKVVLSANWGAAVSQNPFLSFKFKGGAPGDKVIVSWKDNKGESRTDEVALR